MSDEKDKTEKHPSETKPWLFKPGQSGNPKGKPAGIKSNKSKVFTMLSKLWGQQTAETDWFAHGLEFLANHTPRLTVDELIMWRVKWCLATNTKYNNTALLTEHQTRMEGRVAYKHLTKEQEDENYDDVSDDDLRQWVEEFDQRAKDEAAARKLLKEPDADPNQAD